MIILKFYLLIFQRGLHFETSQNGMEDYQVEMEVTSIVLETK